MTVYSHQVSQDSRDTGYKSVILECRSLGTWAPEDLLDSGWSGWSLENTMEILKSSIFVRQEHERKYIITILDFGVFSRAD